MKVFNYGLSIGKCKYAICYHDGIKKHSDGSRFFDIKTFRIRKDQKEFAKELLSQGYIESLE